LVTSVGAYGDVYRCCKKVDEKQMRAVKMILKKETEHEFFLREAESLREINHPNII
jgi:serine/threonine protein kinase